MKVVNNQINSLNQTVHQVTENKPKSEQNNNNYEKSIINEKDKPIEKKEEGSKEQVDEKALINAIEKANKKIQGNDKEFQYSVHEQTKQIMVKVIDRQSGEVINEFPPEKILDMVAKMWETAGLLVDERR